MLLSLLLCTCNVHHDTTPCNHSGVAQRVQRVVLLIAAPGACTACLRLVWYTGSAIHSNNPQRMQSHAHMVFKIQCVAMIGCDADIMCACWHYTQETSVSAFTTQPQHACHRQTDIRTSQFPGHDTCGHTRPPCVRQHAPTHLDTHYALQNKS